MQFKITIEEMVSQSFNVEAETMEEAMETAEAKYKSGEFVLEPGNLVTKQMMAENDNGDSTEWTEF
jgi:hypothetical protein